MLYMLTFFISLFFILWIHMTINLGSVIARLQTQHPRVFKVISTNHHERASLLNFQPFNSLSAAPPDKIKS